MISTLSSVECDAKKERSRRIYNFSARTIKWAKLGIDVWCWYQLRDKLFVQQLNQTWALVTCCQLIVVVRDRDLAWQSIRLKKSLILCTLICEYLLFICHLIELIWSSSSKFIIEIFNPKAELLNWESSFKYFIQSD